MGNTPPVPSQLAEMELQGLREHLSAMNDMHRLCDSRGGFLKRTHHTIAVMNAVYYVTNGGNTMLSTWTGVRGRESTYYTVLIGGTLCRQKLNKVILPTAVCEVSKSKKTQSKCCKCRRHFYHNNTHGQRPLIA